MKTLLKYDFRRLLHSSAALTCLLISTILSLIVGLSIVLAFLIDGGLGGSIGFPTAIEMTGNVFTGLSFIISILLAIFVALYAGEEKYGGVLKTILSRGFSRVKMFFSKLIITLIYSLVLLVATWLVFFLTMLIAFGELGTLDFTCIAKAFTFVLLVLTYVCIYNFMVALCNKMSTVLVLAIGSTYIGGFSTGLIIGIFSMYGIDASVISFYWLDTLIPMVLVEFGTAQIIASIVSIVLYGGASIALGVWASKKKQV